MEASRRIPANAIRTVKASQKDARIPATTPWAIKNETKQSVALTGWANTAMRIAMLSSFGEMSDSASGTITKTANKKIFCMRSVSRESPVRIRSAAIQIKPPTAGTSSSELRCRNHQLWGRIIKERTDPAFVRPWELRARRQGAVRWSPKRRRRQTR
jgi:hypothetical protein